MWQEWLSQYLQAVLERGRLFVPASAPEALGWTVGVVVTLGLGWVLILTLAFSTRSLLRPLVTWGGRELGLGLAAAYLSARLVRALVFETPLASVLGSTVVVVCPTLWVGCCIGLLYLLDALVVWRLKESP